MKILILKILSSDLGRALTAMPFIMVINHLFGAALAGFGQKFDSNRLKAGLSKGFLVYVGIAIFAGVSMYLPELQVEFNNELYSVVDGMYLVIWAAVGMYAVDAFDKLIKLFKVETGDI